MTLSYIKTALAKGASLDSEDEKRYVTEENMAGGKYCCWANNEFGHAPVKLTNDLQEAIDFISDYEREII